MSSSGRVLVQSRLGAFGVLVAVALLIGLAATAPQAQAARKPTLQIGMLLSMTGNSSALGRNTRESVDIAVKRFARSKHRRVKVRTFNTQLDPGQALKGLKLLAKRGVRIIVGPQSSAELAYIRPTANRLGVVLVSTGSTASSLAIPNDEVFRLVPDDKVETQASAAMMLKDGIERLVPFWRTDVGNQGLHDSIKSLFTLIRGNGSFSGGVGYAPNTPVNPTQALSLRDQVNAARTGSKKTAVYVAGFDDVAQAIQQANTYPVLSNIRWYGGDGIVNSPVMAADPVVTKFAAEVGGIPSPIYALDPNRQSYWLPVKTEVQRRTGLPADAFAITGYDAATLSLYALTKSSSRSSASTIARKFSSIASRYVGISGITTLNPAGDRTTGAYTYYALCPNSAPTPGSSWRAIGSWLPPANSNGRGTVQGKTRC